MRSSDLICYMDINKLCAPSICLVNVVVILLEVSWASWLSSLAEQRVLRGTCVWYFILLLFNRKALARFLLCSNNKKKPNNVYPTATTTITTTATNYVRIGQCRAECIVATGILKLNCRIRVQQRREPFWQSQTKRVQCCHLSHLVGYSDEHIV